MVDLPATHHPGRVMPDPDPDGHAMAGPVSQASDGGGPGMVQAMLDVVGQSADAMVVANEQGRVVLFNAAAVRLWGCEAAAILGAPLHEVLPCPAPPWRADDRAAVSAWLDSMQGRDRETVIITGDGSLLRITMSLSVVQCSSQQLAVACLRPLDIAPPVAAYRGLLAQAADESDSAIIVTGAHREVLYVNRGFQRIFDYTLDDLADITPAELLAGPHTGRFLRPHSCNHLPTSGSAEEDLLLYTRSGRPVWVSTAVTPVHGPGDQLNGLVCVLTEVTQAKMAQGLQASALDAMTRDLPLAEVMTGICHKVEQIAPELMVLVSAVDAEGRQHPLAGPSLPPALLAALEQMPMDLRACKAWAGGDGGQATLVDHLRPDPTTGAHHLLALDAGLVSSWVSPVRSSDGRMLGTLAFYLRQDGGPRELHSQLAGICLPICALSMERKQSADRMHQLAFYDALTGLPNRFLFSQSAGQGLGQPGRKNNRAAVLLVNLDRFKRINDTQGHVAGDELLCEVGKRLQQEVGPHNLIGRLAGDEFVVMLPGTSAEQAGSMAERVLSVISAPVLAGRMTVEPGASVGVALYPEDGRNIEMLLRCAEMAMTRSKAEGGARCVFFSNDMQRMAQERVTLETALIEALREGNINLHFQPQMRVDSGDRQILYGVEALARWTHPLLGEIPPQRFVEVAEAIGVADELSHWVVRRACAQLAEWRARDVAIPRLSVNMSANNFRDQELAAMLGLILGEYGLRPTDLTLEITESVMLDPDPDVLFNIEAIYAMGICLSLDDFGTGYSSLSHLHRLPIHELKLDKSFVRDIESSAIARTLTTSVLRIGESLGMTVIAEGVETEAQQCFLAEQGCPVLQGYLLSRPLPPEAIEAWLRSSGHTAMRIDSAAVAATGVEAP